MPVVYFSHGQASGPWGSKIKAMAKAVGTLGCNAKSVDYQGISDPTERVEKLITECQDVEKPLVLVGSSMGGYVATAAATHLNAIGLFVLAPAYYIAKYEHLTPPPPDIPISIVHGWHDEIIPPENSIRFASECYATLHLVNGDHRLTENIDEIIYYLTQFIRDITSNNVTV